MRRSFVLNPYQFSSRWIICQGLVFIFSFCERMMLKLSSSSFLKSSCISKVVISMPCPGTQSISSKIKLGWNSRLSQNFRTIVDKLRVSLLMEAVSVQISMFSCFLGSSLFLIGFISSSVDTLEPAFSFLHLNLPWESMRWLTWWRIMIWWVPPWKCIGAIEVLLARSRMILLILATVFWKLKYCRRCSASALRYWDSRQLMRLRGFP